jgi:hypothetical protein
MKAHKVVLAFFAALIVFTLGSMYVRRSTPTFRLRGCADCPSIIVLLNPFRARDPEREVDRWLRTGTLNKWGGVTVINTPAGWSAEICRNSASTLNRWTLKDREDSSSGSFLYYKVSCSGYAGRLFVRMRRDISGWRVVSFTPTPTS